MAWKKACAFVSGGGVVWESRGTRCAECAAVACVEEGVVYKRRATLVPLVWSVCMGGCVVWERGYEWKVKGL